MHEPLLPNLESLFPNSESMVPVPPWNRTPANVYKNSLTDEELKNLQACKTENKMTPSKIEKIKCRCNHRDVSGVCDSLIIDEKGFAKCKICGAEFKPISSDNDIHKLLEETSKNAIDILQTIKIMYPDMPPEISDQYYGMIPLLERLPDLFEIANNNFNQKETKWRND